MRRACCILLLAACGASSNGDVVGPFTGPVHRYVIDRITLPTDQSSVRALGDDLNGDGTVDNQVGSTIHTLSTYKDTTDYGGDQIAAGVIASSIEIQATDLDNDSRVGVTYFGADGEQAMVTGGTLKAGVFVSNRTQTTHVPGSATAHLPVFADADPSIVELQAMELDLTPDGSGGYDGLVRGAIAQDNLMSAVTLGITQMIVRDPSQHYDFAKLVDTNRDGAITSVEIKNNSLIASLLAPDVTLFGHQLTSLGFGVHLLPCDSGDCATHAPAQPCFDRVRDGLETDVDCGGPTCAPCPGGATCAVASDCASNACDSGTCRTQSCTDGVRDGLETDVDCGWNCPPCPFGDICTADTDCSTGHCNAVLGASTGICVAM